MEGIMWFNRVCVQAKNLLAWRKKSPIIEGASSLERVSNHLKMNGHKKIAIITSKNILEIAIVEQFLAKLQRDKIEFVVYDQLNKQPTLDTVQKTRIFVANFAPDAIVAIGGSGVVECAKIVSVAAKNPRKSYQQLFGLGKWFVAKTPLIVAPTTLGGGAENAAMAYIGHEKNMLFFTSPALQPSLVVIDPLLVEQTPNHVVAYSAIECLGKAVESFVSALHFDGHNEYAPMAIKMIFDGLEKSLAGEEGNFKTKLQKASYLAGAAFQNEKAGYALALANQIAITYNVHVGHAYALTLIPVLKAQKQAITKKLAFLCDYCHFGTQDQTEAEKANVFLSAVENLIEKAGPFAHINFVEGDFIKMVEATILHTNCHHAPASFLTPTQLFDILQQLKEK